MSFCCHSEDLASPAEMEARARKAHGPEDGDNDEPCEAIEGLSSDHSRNPLSSAGPSRDPAELRLAGTRYRAPLSGAAQIPRLLAPGTGWAVALGAGRLRQPDQAPIVSTSWRLSAAALDQTRSDCTQGGPARSEPFVIILDRRICSYRHG